MKSDIEMQESRVSEARDHADHLREEVVKAWDSWSYFRKKEREAFQAYMLEERVLSRMKRGE